MNENARKGCRDIYYSAKGCCEKAYREKGYRENGYPEKGYREICYRKKSYHEKGHCEKGHREKGYREERVDSGCGSAGDDRACDQAKYFCTST